MGSRSDAGTGSDGSTVPSETGLRRARRARVGRRAFIGLLAVFVGLGLAGVFGVRSATVTANGGGYDLTVTFARVTRPGLETPWSVRVRHPGGFEGPVTLATTADYFDLFDENGLDPVPSAARSSGDLLVWEFDPPVGETLNVDFDARLGPAVQLGGSATTAVLVDGRVAVQVRYTTTVMP